MGERRDSLRPKPEAILDLRPQVEGEEPTEQTRNGVADEIGKLGQGSLLRKRAYKAPFQTFQVGRVS